MIALKVLLIDDDTIEAMKLTRTIATLKMNHEIIEAKNGEQALKILDHKYRLPDVVLLDLNMPKMNGIEFLSVMKDREDLSHIPTIILTTSSNSNDLLQCYKLGIAGYVIKPLKHSDYVDKIKRVLEYWSVNELINR